MENSSNEKLKPHNYHWWKTIMTKSLWFRGLWFCLDETTKFDPSVWDYLEWEKLDGAMGLIDLHVSNNLQFHIDSYTTPRTMWLKFENFFVGINEFCALNIQTIWHHWYLIPLYPLRTLQSNLNPLDHHYRVVARRRLTKSASLWFYPIFKAHFSSLLPHFIPPLMLVSVISYIVYVTPISQ